MLVYNNWIYNNINNITEINITQKNNMIPLDNYIKNIIKQAHFIYEQHNNLIVTVSGGVDSQTTAFAFKKANIPVKYVFADFWFNNHRNDLEYLYATQFAKDIDIKLDIVKMEYNIEDVEELMFETGYFNKLRSGIGTTFQFDFMRNLIKIFPVYKIVTSAGIFKFERNNTTCTGSMNDLFRGVNMFAINDDNNSSDKIRKNALSFMYFSPLIINYYEYIHRKNKMLQYPTSYQPKHLATTELGLPIRHKLTSTEHLNEMFDFKNITKFDFGKEWKINMDKFGTNNKLFHDKLVKKYSNNILNKLKNIEYDKGQYIEIYKFETDIFL